jgi:serine protease Do
MNLDFTRIPRRGAVVALAFALGLVTLRASQAADPAQPPERVSFENGFAPVVKRALPAVVSVSSSKIVRTPDNSIFSDPFFRQFFGNQSQTPRKQWEHSLGSGVIVSPEGYILTNNHVVDGATDVRVTLSDRREFTAHIVGRDPHTDIAVLKIGVANLPVLPFGDSSTMSPGDFVLAIGNPYGLTHTVTMGIVSATGRGGLDIEDYEDFIQTDAAINPGNSGGALINVKGQLIGINTAILAQGGDGGEGGNQGIGFAIPINMAREVMDQILKTGKVVRGYLGVYVQNVTPAIAQAFGLPEVRGALIGDVTPDTPASRAGLQKGDVILAVNGKPVTESSLLRLQISMTKPGTVDHFTVFRNGKQIEIPVTLGELPGKPGSTGAQAGPSSSALQGITVDELTPDVLNALKLPVGTKGVVIAHVGSASRAEEAGLKRGDVIQEVNHQPVDSVTEFQAAARAADGKPVLLLVNRGGHTLFIVVQP